MKRGVAFFQATGKRRLLDVVCCLADHIDSTFGPGENQLHGYPGHPEIELALMRLYEVTEQPRYMTLASYFIGQRGTQTRTSTTKSTKNAGQTSYWHYLRPGVDGSKDQSLQPGASANFAAADGPIGHAVRFVYLMTGVAHLARLSNDEGKRQDCLRLWKKYGHSVSCISPGGIGSQSSGESFSSDLRFTRMIRSMAGKLRFNRPDDVRPPDAGNGSR
ncbi:glycosyl hydrolase [Salmonella enterica subsp. enterica]|uniref:Glycosyl hydrolase n=1 Tax=Salmonella enterica I TaxID=59201 RepID=A0A3S4INF4_SALET|nr:glycosyl hydrolase [Salmonella enterica subsp. enterica]